MYRHIAYIGRYVLACRDDQKLEARLVLCAWIFLGLSAITSVFNPAPYGKFAGHTAGLPFLARFTTVKVPAGIGWCLQEVPAFIVSFLAIIHIGHSIKSLLLLPFVLHYLNRSFIYPLQLNKNSKPIPLLTFSTAILFCSCNGLLQSQAVINLDVSRLNPVLSALGFLAFLLGMAINLQSDSILRGLRRPGDTGYRIPRGGLYSLVSAPNYFGETLEWFGFAALTQTHAALWFAMFSLTFLGGRALQTHGWYCQKFGAEYPADRKAFIPYIL